MNKKEQKIIREIKRDCLALKKAGKLTEYGKGQLDFIKILKEINN